VRPTLQRPDPALVRAAFTYGLPLAFSGALVWVSGNGIRFIIEHKMDTAAVGLFSVGWTIGQRASLFAAMLVTAAAFPLALRIDATGQRGKALQQLSTNGALLCAVLFPSCAGLAILSGPLTRLTVASDYVAVTAAILPIATLGGFIKNLRSHFANQPFLLAEKTRWTLALDVVEAVLFLAGAIAGLEWYGLVGAAAGSLLSVFVGAACAFWLAVKKLGMPMPVAHLARITLATAAMSAVVLAMPAERWDTFLVTVVVGAGVYAGILALLYRGQLGEFRAALKPSAS
jgi:O-antigen/teichoic acid export membrane protein